jgi:hypothetical protein
MALTPGRTPLPPPAGQGPQTMTTVSDTGGTNLAVAKSTPELGTQDLRLGIFAKPGDNAAATGSSANRPLRKALKDFHPVRDIVKAGVSTIKKVVGKEDNSSAAADSDSED